MQLIPRATPTTQVAPLPGVRQTARLDTSGLQRGLDTLGRQIGAVLEQQRARIDHARLMEARAELANLGNSLHDPQNPEGVLSFRGERALEANERLLPKVDQRITQIRQRLTPTQQAQFDGIAAGWRESFTAGLNRHMAQESEQAIAAKGAAFTASLANEAALHGLSGRVDLQQASIAELQAANARRLQLNGAPAEQIAHESAVLASGVYRQTVTGLAARSIPEAVGYFNRTADYLTAADRVAVEAVLFPAIRADVGTQAGMAAINGGDIAAPPVLRSGQEITRDAESVQATFRDIAQRHGATITSMVRPIIARGAGARSQHPKGTAADFRTRDKTPEQVEALMSELRAAGFEVIDERNTDQPHIHAELPPVGSTGAAARFAGPARNVTEALQRLRESPVAKDPVALRAAEQYVRQEFAFRKAEQQEAERATAEAIFQKAAGAPANTPLNRVLSPEELAWLAMHESTNAAISRWRKLTAEGQVIEDDPVLVDGLRRLQATDPGTFARTNLAQYADRLSGATLVTLTNAQKEAGKPGKAAQWASEAELLRLAYAELGITGQGNADKRGQFDLAFRREVRAFVQEKGREPNADETQSLINRLKSPFVRRTWWGGTATRRLYEGAAEGFTVPPTARAQIVEALTEAGIEAPTEAQIVAAYLDTEDATL